MGIQVQFCFLSCVQFMKIHLAVHLAICTMQCVCYTSKKLKVYIIALYYTLKEAFLSQFSSKNKIGCCLVTNHPKWPWQQRPASHPCDVSFGDQLWLYFTSSLWTRSNFHSYMRLFQRSLGRQVIQQKCLSPVLLLLFWLLACTFISVTRCEYPDCRNISFIELNDWEHNFV